MGVSPAHTHAYTRAHTHARTHTRVRASLVTHTPDDSFQLTPTLQSSTFEGTHEFSRRRFLTKSIDVATPRELVVFCTEAQSPPGYRPLHSDTCTVLTFFKTVGSPSKIVVFSTRARPPLRLNAILDAVYSSHRNPDAYLNRHVCTTRILDVAKTCKNN